MEAEVGETARPYIGNGSVTLSSSIPLVGEIFGTVYPEANLRGVVFCNVQTSHVPAGGATMVGFQVDYRGDYVLLVDHAFSRVDKGAWGVLRVRGEATPEVFEELD